MSYTTLQRNIRKQYSSHRQVKMNLLRSSDRKNKYLNKYCHSQIQNENEIKNIFNRDKTITKLNKHLPSENKNIKEIHNLITESNINLQPLVVLYHRKNKNLKKNSNEIIFFKEPSKRLKTISEKLNDYKLSLQNKHQLGKALYIEDENTSTQDNHLIQREKPFIQLMLKEEKKEIIHRKSNNKNSRHKQRRKLNKSLVCKNSIPQLETKKRPITNQQVVKEIIKGTSTPGKCFRTENILNKIKSQSVKVEENHLVFMTPSRIEKLFKYVRNPNKYNSCLNESITNVFVQTSNLSNGGKCNSDKSENIHQKINAHESSKTLSEQLAFFKKDTSRCNSTQNKSNLQDSFKNSIKKGRKKNTFKLQMKNQMNNNYSNRPSKHLKGHQIRNNSFKHDLVREHESYAATSNTAHNTKYNIISHKNPKLSPIVSETFTVKPEETESAEFVRHKSSSVKPTADQLKREQSSLLKYTKKPHKLKKLFDDRISTELANNKGKHSVYLQNCKKNSSPKEIKEWSKLHVPKSNIKTIENCLSHQNDQLVYSNESEITSNNLVFSSEGINSLNTIKSNKKLLKVACSNEEKLNKECKENDTKIEMVTNEKAPVRFSNSSKVQVRGSDTLGLERTEDIRNKIRGNVFVVSPKERDPVDPKNKHNTNKNEGISTITEASKEISPLTMTNKRYLSEVGVQTDMQEAFGFDRKEDASAKNEYSTNINQSIFHKKENEAEIPINRKSFVRILVDEDQKNKDNDHVDSNITSSEGGSNITNERSNFNPETLQFSTNESDKAKDQIVNTINTAYKSLLYLNVIMKDNGLRLHGGCQSPCEIEQFKNLLQCLCNNCLEILNKTDLDTSKENNKLTNYNNHIIEQSYNSVDNAALTNVNQFVSILDDDDFVKIGSEQQLQHDQKNNILFKSNCPNMNLISNKTRKTNINSNYVPEKLSQDECPNNIIHYTFENKAKTDLNHRLKCSKNIKTQGNILPHNNTQNMSDKTCIVAKEVGRNISYRNQFRQDDNQDSGLNILNNKFECPFVKKDSIIKCDQGSHVNWIMTEPPSVGKKPLFVNKDCGKRVENNLEHGIKALKYNLFDPDVSKQSVNSFKGDREPFFFVVPSNKTFTEMIKDGNIHQNKSNGTGDEIKCKTSGIQSIAISNLIGDSKFNNNSLNKKDNVTSNYNSVPCQTVSSNNSFKCAFESNLNCEQLNKRSFANDNNELESKDTHEESKHLNKSVSELNILKENAKEQQCESHKVCSTDIPHYNENNTIPTEERKCIKNKVPPLQKKTSNISITIFFSDSESNTSFNQKDSPEEGTGHNNNKLATFRLKNNLRGIRNEFHVSNETSEVQNELDDTDEWICLNKCDFRNSSLYNEEETDKKDKKLGFKMNIKMSDMHVRFFCQPPDLNDTEKTVSVNKTKGNL